MIKKIGKTCNDLMNTSTKMLLSFLDLILYGKFYSFPFGKIPRGSSSEYIRLWEAAKSVSYPIIDQFEDEYGYAVDRDWFDNLSLLTQVVIKKSSICYQHGRLLYACLSKYCEKSNDTCINVLETGTARGFSSLCMAKALADRSCTGTILTIDVIPHDVEIFWNCINDASGPCSRANLLSGYRDLVDKYLIFIQGTTDLSLKKVYYPRIHFAFLDACHTYKDVLYEFLYIYPRQKKGDMVFFDDYTFDQFPGVVSAVDTICEQYNYNKRVIMPNNNRGYVIAEKR